MIPPPPRSTLFPYTTFFRSPMLRAGALRFWISRLWDFHLPREASMLVPHDPTHFERVLRQRLAHPVGQALAQHALEMGRSEEHTSELQSPDHLVCRLLLAQKKAQQPPGAIRLRFRAAGPRKTDPALAHPPPPCWSSGPPLTHRTPSHCR